VITEFTIVPGELEEFKRLAQELLNVVEEKESTTLRYQWFFNKDESRSYVVEEYPNAVALRDHVIHVGIMLPKLLKVSKIAKMDVLGNLNPLAAEAIAALGPQNYRYWNGLAR
jgi:hypothetical protein